MSRITGRVEVLLNGALLLNKAGAVASGVGISGKPNFSLKAVVGDSGLHGYVEEPVMAQCEVTVSDRDDIELSAIAAVRENGTVVFRSAGGGKVYTMEEATCLRDFSITAGEGETKLIFAGKYWTESTSTT